MAQPGNYIFTLDPSLTRQAVTYPNRYGIEISADLYLPANFDGKTLAPAVLVGNPYGAVKEQVAGLYAQLLAQQGIIALAFDPSYNGYSGGSPRHVSSSDIFVEDFHAGLDYLGTREFVDREKLGVVGVCASGVFALSAAQVDPRIKALVTVSMIDISANYAPFYSDAQARRAALADLAEQRYFDFENPTAPAMAPIGSPMEEDANNPFWDFGSFYWRERGHHHNSITQFTRSSDLSFMNFPLLQHRDWIETPVLSVIGQNAVSRTLSQEIHDSIASAEKTIVVEGATHVDLYDKTELIPSQDIAQFLKEKLI